MAPASTATTRSTDSDDAGGPRGSTGRLQPPGRSGIDIGERRLVENHLQVGPEGSQLL